MPWLLVSNVSIDPGRARKQYYRHKVVADLDATTDKRLGVHVSGPTKVSRLPKGESWAYMNEEFQRRNIVKGRRERAASGWKADAHSEAMREG